MRYRSKNNSQLLRLGLLCTAIAVTACSQEREPSATETPMTSAAIAPQPIVKGVERPPNFLILVADDLGVTSMADWGSTIRTAKTATISELAADGMRFDQFWSQPVCTPMRVTTLTGRYSFRHGMGGPLFGIDTIIGLPPAVPKEGGIPALDFSPMGGPVPKGMTPPMPPGGPPPGPDLEELFLPAALKSLDEGYTTAAFGKWHMASHNNGMAKHPNLTGFDHYSGPIDGVVEHVSAWLHVENGEARQEYGYVDQYSADEASAWIAGQEAPWFVWFSFVNPHEPFHKPPAELIQTEALKDLDPTGMTNDNTTEYFIAMVEAMDTLSGQIIESIPKDQRDNTYIIWLGDNGDEYNAYPPEQRMPNRRKMTNYQGGVHVPFVIKGPGIAPGSTNQHMAHVVDIFGTVMELAGGEPDDVTEVTLDSQPFTDQLLGLENPRRREWNFSDFKMFQASQTIRNEHYKLIRHARNDELFDLVNDPEETKNLAASTDAGAQVAYAELSSLLDALLASETKNSGGSVQAPESPEKLTN